VLVAVPIEERYAAYLLGGDRCVCCSKPITFSEMELDHLIPKSLQGKELAEVLALHGIDENFDLDSLENLVPSCRQCNGGKGDRPPPYKPIITMMREAAVHRAPKIRESARLTMTKRELSVAVGKIRVAVKAHGDDPELKSMLEGLMEFVLAVHDRAGAVDPVSFTVHPAMALLWDPENRWKIIGEPGAAVAAVSDGSRSGVIGTHISYRCVRCESNGPWSGNRCQNCGNLQGPWD
jgi:hypothetical protein